MDLKWNILWLISCKTGNGPDCSIWWSARGFQKETLSLPSTTLGTAINQPGLSFQTRIVKGLLFDRSGEMNPLCCLWAWQDSVSPSWCCLRCHCQVMRHIWSLTSKVASSGSNMPNCVATGKSIYFTNANHSRKLFITLLLNVPTGWFSLFNWTWSWLSFGHLQTPNPPGDSSITVPDCQKWKHSVLAYNQEQGFLPWLDANLPSPSISYPTHEQNQCAYQASNTQGGFPSLDLVNVTPLPRGALPPHLCFLFTRFLLILT